jgi:hypothetical protein
VTQFIMKKTGPTGTNKIQIAPNKASTAFLEKEY